jgi:hypothetical protein
MSECNLCGVLVKDRYNMSRHQKTARCKSVKLELEVEQLSRKFKKYRKKFKEAKKEAEKYKEMYDILMEKGIINNTYNITDNRTDNRTDNSTKTTTNQYLNLQGYTLDALKNKMGTFPMLNYQNGQKASEQVARFVAQNVRGENNALTVICGDAERQKFYCLEDEKWMEDVSRQKTVAGVCQCIKEHFGDEQTFIDKLVEKRKQELQDETVQMMEGIENESDLQRALITYKSKVATTISQIVACSGGDENDFSKTYLKKLSTLVRGTKSQRKAVKQMLQ